MTGILHLLLLATFITFASSATTPTNITKILESNPNYSLFNKYLTDTKLDDEINSRETITLLVLPNGAMSSLTKNPISVIKKALSLLILLDYYDPTKLHDLSKGTTLTTTLYQTTGNAPGNLGFVNITDLKEGKVGFGSAAPGSKLESSYTKSIKQNPYTISVLEISAPIIAPGILDVSSNANITALLEKAGCKTFVSLITTSGVLKTYESLSAKGLTLFAPSDEAFKGKDVPNLKTLTNAETVALLSYHALPTYTPKGSLKTSRVPLSTLATNGAGKYDIKVTSSGDEVTLDTGVGTSRVSGTVIDATPLVILTVDKVLLPVELFGKAPAPSPGLEPVGAPAPTPEGAVSPSPESAVAPAPVADSPPAPPSESPEGSPAEAPGPTADSDNVTSPSGAEDMKVSVAALVSVFAGVLGFITL